VFVGSMRTGEIPGTGHMERIVFNNKMKEIRRESMLWELRQRRSNHFFATVCRFPSSILCLFCDHS